MKKYLRNIGIVFCVICTMQACKEEPQDRKFINPVSFLLPAGYDTSDVDIFAIFAKSTDNNSYISSDYDQSFTIYISDGNDLINCDSVLYGGTLLENMLESDDQSLLDGQYSSDDNVNFTSNELKLLNFLSSNFTIQLEPVNYLILNNFMLADTVSKANGFYTSVTGSLANPIVYVDIVASEIHSEMIINKDSITYNTRHLGFELPNNGTINLSSSQLSELTPNRYYFVSVKTNNYKTYMVGNHKMGVYYENINRTLIYLSN